MAYILDRASPEAIGDPLSRNTDFAVGSLVSPEGRLVNLRPPVIVSPHLDVVPPYVDLSRNGSTVSVSADLLKSLGGGVLERGMHVRLLKVPFNGIGG